MNNEEIQPLGSVLPAAPKTLGIDVTDEDIFHDRSRWIKYARKLEVRIAELTQELAESRDALKSLVSGHDLVSHLYAIDDERRRPMNVQYVKHALNCLNGSKAPVANPKGDS